MKVKWQWGRKQRWGKQTKCKLLTNQEFDQVKILQTILAPFSNFCLPEQILDITHGVDRQRMDAFIQKEVSNGDFHSQFCKPQKYPCWQINKLRPHKKPLHHSVVRITPKHCLHLNVIFFFISYTFQVCRRKRFSLLL